MASDEKLKACLYCENDDPFMFGLALVGSEWAVECNECGARGPSEASKEKAIAAYNARAPVPGAVTGYANREYFEKWREGHQSMPLIWHGKKCSVCDKDCIPVEVRPVEGGSGCDCDWVGVRNQVISSGQVCWKCNSVKDVKLPVEGEVKKPRTWPVDDKRYPPSIDHPLHEEEAE